MTNNKLKILLLIIFLGFLILILFNFKVFKVQRPQYFKYKESLDIKLKSHINSFSTPSSLDKFYLNYRFKYPAIFRIKETGVKKNSQGKDFYYVKLVYYKDENKVIEINYPDKDCSFYLKCFQNKGVIFGTNFSDNDLMDYVEDIISSLEVFEFTKNVPTSTIMNRFKDKLMASPTTSTLPINRQR